MWAFVQPRNRIGQNIVEKGTRRLKCVGQEQYKTFVTERLRASQDTPQGELCVTNLNVPLTKNQLKLLSH